MEKARIGSGKARSNFSSQNINQIHTMKIPTQKFEIPNGFEVLQPNRTFESKQEAASFGAIKTWTDIESGKICCCVLVPKSKASKGKRK